MTLDAGYATRALFPARAAAHRAGLVHGLLRPGRRWLAWFSLSLLCGPPLLLVLRTSYQYVVGSAQLCWQSGLQRRRELRNLDPNYRVFPDPRCSPPSWGLWPGKIRQRTLFVLIERFGPMRGSYLGVYPSREEVREALLQSFEMALVDELSSPFPLGPLVFQLTPAVLSRALVDVEYERRAAHGPILNLALVDSSCLVLGYWSNETYHAELIDLSGFGWFAHYVFFEDEVEALPPRL